MRYRFNNNRHDCVLSLCINIPCSFMKTNPICPRTWKNALKSTEKVWAKQTKMADHFK